MRAGTTVKPPRRFTTLVRPGTTVVCGPSPFAAPHLPAAPIMAGQDALEEVRFEMQRLGLDDIGSGRRATRVAAMTPAQRLHAAIAIHHPGTPGWRVPAMGMLHAALHHRTFDAGPGSPSGWSDEGAAASPECPCVAEGLGALTGRAAPAGDEMPTCDVRGALLTTMAPSRGTALHVMCSVSSCSVSCIERLLDRAAASGPDTLARLLHATDSFGSTALLSAIAAKRPTEVLEVLLARDPTPRDTITRGSKSKFTPAHAAAANGNVDALRLLIDAYRGGGVDDPDKPLRAQEGHGWTPLHTGVVHAGLVREVLSMIQDARVLDVRTYKGNGFTPRQQAYFDLHYTTARLIEDYERGEWKVALAVGMWASNKLSPAVTTQQRNTTAPIAQETPDQRLRVWRAMPRGVIAEVLELLFDAAWADRRGRT